MAKDPKTTMFSATPNKKTGWRKKKQGLENVQLKPRRMVRKAVVVVEQEVEEIDRTWGSATDKPGEEDVTQLKRNPTTDSGGLVIEQLVDSIHSSHGKGDCLRHKKKKRKVCKRRQGASTSCTKGKGVQNTQSIHINGLKQDKESDDPKTSAPASADLGKGAEIDDGQEQEQDKGTLECKDKEHNLVEEWSVVLDQEKLKMKEKELGMEEVDKGLEQGKELEKRLHMALEKGLKMQKILHMKLCRELQRELKSHKNQERIKAIVSELERGVKLQLRVEKQLGFRKKREKDLGEPSAPCTNVAALKVTEAVNLLSFSSDLQSPVA